MPLMTKAEAEQLAERVMHYRRMMPQHSQQEDMKLAAEFIKAVIPLVIVGWPIAIGE